MNESEMTLTWRNVRPNLTEMLVGVLLLIGWLMFFGAGVLIPTSDLRGALLESISARATVRPIPTTAPIVVHPRSDLGNLEIAGYFTASVAAFTVTNLFFLATASAFIGAMTQRWSTPFHPPDLDPATRFKAATPEPTTTEPAAPDAAGRESSAIERAATAASTEGWPRIQYSRREEQAITDLRRAYLTATLRGFLAYALIVAGYLVVIPENSLASITPGQYIRLSGVVTSICFLVGYEPNSLARLLRVVFATADVKPEAKEAPVPSTEIAASVKETKSIEITTKKASRAAIEAQVAKIQAGKSAEASHVKVK